jgi:hypothetical protein
MYFTKVLDYIGLYNNNNNNYDKRNKLTNCNASMNTELYPRMSSVSKNTDDSNWNHPNLEYLNHDRVSEHSDTHDLNYIGIDIKNKSDSIDTVKSVESSLSGSSVHTPGHNNKILFKPCDANSCERCAKENIIPEHTSNNAISYKKMSAMLNDMYYNSVSEKSTALDIISIYLKGQKILYTEAKTYCEQIRNCLMLPAILLSALSTVISLQFSTEKSGGIIVSSISATNTIVLSILSYLKLDAKAESHRISSYKFDKIQSLCEFKSGKILLLDDENILVNDILEEIETQVKDIKETNQFILPEKIRYRFPVLYSTNVFSIVKKLRNDEIVLTNKLTTIVNKMIQVNNNEPDEETQKQLIELEKQQNITLEEIIHFRDRYLEIDSQFNDEIERYISKSKKNWNIFHWLKT